jgi:ABC-type bacteriocin/lantibiotic exporter with double-glycine peptidase domain
MLPAGTTTAPAPYDILTSGLYRKKLNQTAGEDDVADIELRNVNKSFGTVKVIENLSLKIESGEFMVFLGPSGCGKSTLLRIIAGL